MVTHAWRKPVKRMVPLVPRRAPYIDASLTVTYAVHVKRVNSQLLNAFLVSKLISRTKKMSYYKISCAAVSNCTNFESK